MTRQINTHTTRTGLGQGFGRLEKFAALMLLVTVFLVAAADLLRMMGESNGTTTGSIDSSAGPAALEAMMAAIAGNPMPYNVAMVLTFAAAFTAVPAVLIGWRLTVKATPAMAWAAAVVGTLFVFGRVTHTFSAYALPLILAKRFSAAEAASFYSDLNLNWGTMLVIIPTLLGIALWFPLISVAFYRGQVIPLWAMICVLLGTTVLMVLGSSFVATPIFGVLTIAGMVPVFQMVGGGRKWGGNPA